MFFNCLNAFVMAPLTTFTLDRVGLEMLHPSSIDKLPSISVFFASVIFCSMFEDLTFYVTHRILHLRWLYPSIHKIHHEN